MIPGNPQGHLCATSEDVAAFLAWIDDCVASREVMAIDTETTGLSWWEPQFVRLVTYSTADVGWAVPVEWWGKVNEEAMRRLVASSTQVVFHNRSFDMHALRVARYPQPLWANTHDTAILLHLHRSDLSRALKGKGAAEVLGNWVFHAKDNLNKVAKEKYGLDPTQKWAHIPVDEPAYWSYAIIDTIITRRLYDALQDVQRDFAAPIQREYHYGQIMHRAEIRGLVVDEGYTLQLRDQMTTAIENDLYFLRANGLENPNSNDQVLALLEEDFGFVPWEFTETGNPSVNKGVLAVLAKAGGLQTDVVEALVRYKRNVKWRSTYLDRFLEGADIHGRVHPQINTMQARTGRSSITGPPLQTLPSGDPTIRRCILAPPGTRWYSLDYSNQEPRNLAYYGRSPELWRYFTEGDGTGSIHDFVAGELFGPDYTYEQRGVSKQAGLARSYGAGADKIAAASGQPVDFVQAFLPRYDKLVGLADLNHNIMQTAAERQPHPYIITGGGRRAYSDPEKEYTLVNFLMQGTGADQLKDAAIALDYAGLSDNIVVPVHDEITFAFPRDEGPELAREAAQLMREAAEHLCPGIPFPVDIEGPAKSWGAIYDPEMQ